MASALYGGSFDPIHNGHLSVIAQCCALFESVHVAVLVNSAKPAGLLLPEERVDLIERCTEEMGGVNVCSYDGLIVDLAHQIGATTLIRTMHKERSPELAMASANHRLGSVPTLMVVPDVSTSYISSSMVRELHAAGWAGEIGEMVPGPVFDALRHQRRQPPTSQTQHS